MNNRKLYILAIVKFIFLAGLVLLDSRLLFNLNSSAVLDGDYVPKLAWNICFPLLLGLFLAYEQWRCLFRASGKLKISWPHFALITALLVLFCLIVTNRIGGLLLFGDIRVAFPRYAPSLWLAVGSLSACLLIPIGFLLAHIIRRAPTTAVNDNIFLVDISEVAASLDDETNVVERGIRPYLPIALWLAVILLLCAIEYWVMTATGGSGAARETVQDMLAQKRHISVWIVLSAFMLLGTLLSCRQWRLILRSRGGLKLNGPYILLCLLLLLLLGYMFYGWLSRTYFSALDYTAMLAYSHRWYVYIFLGFFLPHVFRSRNEGQGETCMELTHDKI